MRAVPAATSRTSTRICSQGCIPHTRTKVHPGPALLLRPAPAPNTRHPARASGCCVHPASIHARARLRPRLSCVRGPRDDCVDEAQLFLCQLLPTPAGLGWGGWGLGIAPPPWAFPRREVADPSALRLHHLCSLTLAQRKVERREGPMTQPLPSLTLAVPAAAACGAPPPSEGGGWEPWPRVSDRSCTPGALGSRGRPSASENPMTGNLKDKKTFLKFSAITTLP